MRPFPPINRLERVEAHAAVHLAVLRDGLIFFDAACQAPSDSGGSTPITGFHSVIESPDSVSRVAPPTKTIASTNAATA